jgi:hypothetical protein
MVGAVVCMMVVDMMIGNLLSLSGMGSFLISLSIVSMG